MDSLWKQWKKRMLCMSAVSGFPEDGNQASTGKCVCVCVTWIQPYSKCMTWIQPHSRCVTWPQPHSGCVTWIQPYSRCVTWIQPHSRCVTWIQPYSRYVTWIQPHSRCVTRIQPHSRWVTWIQPHRGWVTWIQPHSRCVPWIHPHNRCVTQIQPHCVWPRYSLIVHDPDTASLCVTWPQPHCAWPGHSLIVHDLATASMCVTCHSLIVCDPDTASLYMTWPEPHCAWPRYSLIVHDLAPASLCLTWPQPHNRHSTGPLQICTSPDPPSPPPCPHQHVKRHTHSMVNSFSPTGRQMTKLMALHRRWNSEHSSTLKTPLTGAWPCHRGSVRMSLTRFNTILKMDKPQHSRSRVKMSAWRTMSTCWYTHTQKRIGFQRQNLRNDKLNSKYMLYSCYVTDQCCIAAV